MNVWILTVWSSTGPVPPLRTASVTPGFRTPTWCAFVGRLSPLQPPVSRNSWPTSSAGNRRWPPSTKFSCGPTRAHHKPPPAPPRQICQHHLSHLSPSENRLPNTRWRDFKTRLRAAGWGGPFRFELLNVVGRKKPQETSSGCDLRRFLFLFWFWKRIFSHWRELLVTRAWVHFLYGGPCSYEAARCLQVSTSRFVTLHTFWINYFLSYCQLCSDERGAQILTL